MAEQDNPRVSIVLPCFNGAATLADAIQSVCRQTCADWELIIFDDGSTDASRDIASAFMAQDSRIRIISSHHVGIVSALRGGCDVARGEFIARMDADDVAHPHRLAAQIDLMDRQPDLAVCGTQVEAIGPAIGLGRRRYTAWVNDLVSHESMVRELFVECPIPHPTFLMRRDALERVGGYQDRGWAEDYDLLMRFFAAGCRFGKVAAPLLQWREWPGRMSRTDPRYSLERFRELKRHYLAQTYLKGQPRFHQWGAGEVGKAWLQEWGERKPEAVVDVNPRKIGRRVHGVRVISPDGLPPPGETFVVATVGAPGARDDIRLRLAGRGFTELRDFLFLA